MDRYWQREVQRSAMTAAGQRPGQRAFRFLNKGRYR
jgi:hypothetical protein